VEFAAVHWFDPCHATQCYLPEPVYQPYRAYSGYSASGWQIVYAKHHGTFLHIPHEIVVDLLQAAAAVASIVAAIAGVGALLRRPSHPPDDQAPTLPARILAKLRPRQLDILPAYFEGFLNQAKPEMQVTVYAVNYLRRDLVLDEVRVQFLQVSRGESVEDLTATDLRIPGRQYRLVTCRRRLVESEIASFLALPHEEHYRGSVRVTAKGRAWFKRVTFAHLLNFQIGGWLDRPSS
jgi:hypothetical protein